jgi:hypothetical protein
MGHHLDMAVPTAELSSVSTALSELTRRLAVMADQAAVEHDDESAAELFAVERALTGAGRRLARLTDPRRRTPDGRRR